MAREDGDMNRNGADLLEGASPSYVEGLYRRYSEDPASVEPGWQRWFEGLESGVSGPSWSRPNWPLTQTDALTAGLDPTQMAIDRPAPPPGAPKNAQSAPQTDVAPAAGGP